MCQIEHGTSVCDVLCEAEVGAIERNIGVTPENIVT